MKDTINDNIEIHIEVVATNAWRSSLSAVRFQGLAASFVATTVLVVVGDEPRQ